MESAHSSCHSTCRWDLAISSKLRAICAAPCMNGCISSSLHQCSWTSRSPILRIIIRSQSDWRTRMTRPASTTKRHHWHHSTLTIADHKDRVWISRLMHTYPRLKACMDQWTWVKEERTYLIFKQGQMLVTHWPTKARTSICRTRKSTSLIKVLTISHSSSAGLSTWKSTTAMTSQVPPSSQT